MSDDTKRETMPAREDRVAHERDEARSTATVGRRPAVRFWEITLSSELDAAVHVIAI